MDTKKPTDTAATVIIGQKVRAGSEQAFEAWQKDMNREASKYPGFLGAEINPPTAVQPDWVVVYRFDSDRPRAGLDQQRAPGRSGWPRVSSTSTAPAPSRCSAAARGRRIPSSPSSSPTA